MSYKIKKSKYIHYDFSVRSGRGLLKVDRARNNREVIPPVRAQARRGQQQNNVVDIDDQNGRVNGPVLCGDVGEVK